MSPAGTKWSTSSRLPWEPAAAAISSSVSSTHLPLLTSNPLTMSLYSIALPSFGHIRRCSIRLPSLAWTSWKCTVLDSVAEYTLTGTATRPNVIVPFQIERGMSHLYPFGSVHQHRRRFRRRAIGPRVLDRRGLLLRQQRGRDGERDDDERQRPPVGRAERVGQLRSDERALIRRHRGGRAAPAA